MQKCGLTLVRTTPYEGADVIEGAEHGEVEYAIISAWLSSSAKKPIRRPSSGIRHLSVEVGFGGRQQ